MAKRKIGEGRLIAFATTTLKHTRFNFAKATTGCMGRRKERWQLKTLAELTIEDIDGLLPGPELDALIAEAIGLTVKRYEPPPPSQKPFAMVHPPPYCRIETWPIIPPQYSASLNDASAAWERFLYNEHEYMNPEDGHPNGFDVTLDHRGWTVKFWQSSRAGCHVMGQAQSRNAPVAVCMAVLKMVLFQRDQGKDSHTPTDDNRVLTNEQ